MDKKDKKIVEEFKHLFSVFRRPKQHFSVHPSRVILRRYTEGKLNDRWVCPTVEPSGSLWMKEETQPAWTLAEVSLHVVRCVRCSKTVARWRKYEQQTGFDEHNILAFGWAGQQVRLWAYACATVVLALLAFQVVTFSPSLSSEATSTFIVRDVELKLDHPVINGYSLFSYFQQQKTEVKSRLKHLEML